MRNPEEIAICRIAGSTVIPLPELANRLGELDPTTAMVVHCKSGVRSAKAITLLQAAGFSRSEEPQGRDPGLDQGGRSELAGLLSFGLSEKSSDLAFYWSSDILCFFWFKLSPNKPFVGARSGV